MTYSDPQPIYCGVPHGTGLDPLLFLVTVNELANDESDPLSLLMIYPYWSWAKRVFEARRIESWRVCRTKLRRAK